jgi:hypothetical protein
MKKLYITLAFLLGGIVLFAQTIPQELDKPNPNPRKKKVKNLQSSSSTTQPENHFKSPDVIPPSPDVAAFGKFGEIPVGLYSGIVPIDVPFYTVKSKDITVPIGLNLHTGGIRVEEIASWTGLSTALQAGGSISRSVIGRADDKRGGYLNQYLYTPAYLDSLAFYVPNSAYSQINPSVTNPIRHKWTVFDDQTKYYDAQPDSYNYSFGGRSGKFVIDQTNPTVGIPIPYVPIKITITYTNNQPPNAAAKDSLVEEANPFYGTMESFTITDENGLEYFYNEKETTNSKHLDPRQKTRFQYFYSAWHLSKITSPMGGQVRFSYTNYSHYHRQWSAEDRRNRDTEACPTTIGSDGYPEDINYIQRTQSQIRIGGKHISEIAWENGKVTFTPSSTNRQDVNEKSLQYVSVFDADNALKKKYSLFYSNTPLRRN